MRRIGARFQSGLSRRGLDPRAGEAAAALGNYLYWLFGGIAVLTLAGVVLSPLTVIAGAFRFGVGFGLQALIQNFVAGMLILVSRPIKTGNRIKAGNLAKIT